MANNTKTKDLLLIIFFLLIGFVIRLYPLSYKNIINPDGVSYINQAKAILDGNWKLAVNCGYKFISLYHILIPFFFKLTGDWIIAAKSISLLFGTLTIIPFYLISKQFFRKSTLLLTVLAFSINPFLVSHSEDLIKGPIFWFFALLGVYFFITVFNEQAKTRFLLLSSISFLIAGWARLEIITYIIGSIIYILFSEKEKTKRLFTFCLPIMILALMVISELVIYQKIFSFWSFYMGPRMIHFNRDLLNNILTIKMIGKMGSAVILIINRSLRVVYIPFLLLLLPGLWAVKSELKRNRNFNYFILLSLLSFAAVIIHYIKTGIITDRYTAFAVLPLYIFICTGIEKISLYLKSKGIKEKRIILSICLYIVLMVIAFPHLLVHRRKDQVIFEDIGKYIAHLEGNQQVKMVASDPRITFFANLYSEGIECAHTSFTTYDLITKKKYAEMVSTLKEKKIKYFLWEKKYWGNSNYDFLTVANPEHFEEIMRWDAKRGKLIAFKVLY